MALSHCMAVALAYRFEFKQYSNRLIIHQLCDFNMAPHAASNLSCCRYVMRVFVERDTLSTKSFTIPYEMNMKWFLTHNDRISSSYSCSHVYVYQCIFCKVSEPAEERIQRIERACAHGKKFNFAKWHITMHMTVRKYTRPWTPVSISFRCF